MAWTGLPHAHGCVMGCSRSVVWSLSSYPRGASICTRPAHGACAPSKKKPSIAGAGSANDHCGRCSTRMWPMTLPRALIKGSITNASQQRQAWSATAIRCSIESTSVRCCATLIATQRDAPLLRNSTTSVGEPHMEHSNARPPWFTRRAVLGTAATAALGAYGLSRGLAAGVPDRFDGTHVELRAPEPSAKRGGVLRYGLLGIQK